MSYHKMTCISGRDGAGNYINSVRPGHWRPATAEQAARRMRILGPVEVTHSIADLSGHGRGGYDRKYSVCAGVAREVPLSVYEREATAEGDASDIHALCDGCA